MKFIFIFLNTWYILIIFCNIIFKLHLNSMILIKNMKIRFLKFSSIYCKFNFLFYNSIGIVK